MNFGGVIHVMQMYQGESPSVATKRFCGMLKFEENQCVQVRNVFYNMCLDSGIIHDDLMDTEDIPTNIKDNDIEDINRQGTEKPSSNSAREYFLESLGISSTITEHFKDYWNWVALVIVLFYVILHHN